MTFPTQAPPSAAPYIVIATEYERIVGVTPCDELENALDVAEWSYNAQKYHTHGNVFLYAYDESEDEYLLTDWPEPDDGP